MHVLLLDPILRGRQSSTQESRGRTGAVASCRDGSAGWCFPGKSVGTMRARGSPGLSRERCFPSAPCLENPLFPFTRDRFEPGDGQGHEPALRDAGSGWGDKGGPATWSQPGQDGQTHRRQSRALPRCRHLHPMPLAARITLLPLALQARQKTPRILHQDNWGCLSSRIWVSFFFRIKKRSHELLQQPRLSTIYQKPQHAGPFPHVEPHHAHSTHTHPPPPPALRRRGLRQRDWISRESLCRAGSLCKSFTFLWFDPRLPRSRRSSGESMTARDRLGWGRECRVGSRDALGERRELTASSHGMRGPTPGDARAGRRKPGLKADN